MHTFVKNTAAIHHLALATAFGGPIFALAGVRQAVLKEVEDEKQRGRILADAWRSFSKINVPAHLAFTATWLIERRIINKMNLTRRTQRLVALKDVLITGALVTGVANAVVGKLLNKDFPQGMPVTDKPTTDAKAYRYTKFYRVMGPANLFFVGASLAIGPAIAFGVLRSAKLNFVKRLLSK
jgi:uncharacterized membrane protein